MTSEVIAWPIFFSSCFCRSAYSSAPPSVSSDPRPGFVRGFFLSLSRASERARIAAGPSGRTDISPVPSPHVLRRFRASWTRAAGERNTAADLCTAYNARTGLTTRFAVRPIKYHSVHVSRALRAFSRLMRRCTAFRSAHHAIAAAERDRRWGRAKGQPGSGHFRLRFRAVFLFGFWVDLPPIRGQALNAPHSRLIVA